jgi:hypothetical protein
LKLTTGSPLLANYFWWLRTLRLNRGRRVSEVLYARRLAAPLCLSAASDATVAAICRVSDNVIVFPVQTEWSRRIIAERAMPP